MPLRSAFSLILWLTSAVALADPVAQVNPPAAIPAAANPAPSARSVEQLAKDSGPSIVVITHTGRDGDPQGLGTGFVIGSEGRIATNLHVIGEARPISVQLADGRKFDVQSVEASDRGLDLAVLKIDARDLPALPLAESPAATGAAIVALGNPRGLKHSVVSGVISGMREIDGRSMIQIALPIEPGNSGGPVLDAQGRVQGIVTLKLAVSENLGFAMPVAALRTLLAKPNPVPMSRWLTIGALPEKDWKPLLGGVWRQRAGKLTAAGLGEGFGGRSLCLYQHSPPELPMELAVSVKLEDERGAAGLVFAADGSDRHYGFYPTGGRLRLTRFDGATVFQWQVLRETTSPHYHPGEWNELKVRREKDGSLRCLVNGEVAIEIKDDVYLTGQVGLAQFRGTAAEFKQFRAGKSLPSSLPSAAAAEKIAAILDKLPDAKQWTEEHVASLSSLSAAPAVLHQKAEQLRSRAAMLDQLTDELRTAAIAAELSKMAAADDAAFELDRAALLVSQLDNPELEIETYLAEINRLAGEIKSHLPAAANPEARLAAMQKVLFTEQGFHGSRTDFYHRANSYLDRVLDDREGLPITLAVLYLELGRRLDVPLSGLPLPGRFMVQFAPQGKPPQWIDVFDGGKVVTRDEAARIVRETSDATLKDGPVPVALKREIIERMIVNLQGLALRRSDRPALLRYATALVALNQNNAAARGQRAIMLFESGRKAAAISELDWLIEHQPPDVDLDKVRDLREHFRQE